MVPVISLDAGNTLLHCEPSPTEIYTHHLSRLGRPVPEDLAAEVFRRVWAEMQRSTPPGGDRYSVTPGGERAWWRRFVHRVVEELQHDAPADRLFHDLYEAFTDPAIWRVFPDVHDTLDTLRGHGYRLIVLSNWDSRLPDLLYTLELHAYFDEIVVSAIEHTEKPAPEIFHRAAERSGVPPADTLHVGDSPREDYGGALDAGCQAVLLDRRQLFNGDGYRRIGTLTELPQIVRT